MISARHAGLPALLFLFASPVLAQPPPPRLFDTWMAYDVGTYTTGRNNVSVAVGDIDGDLDLDFVASKHDFAAFNFAVVKNNGDGTFGRQVLVSAISESGDIALADVDGDSDLDVILANAGVAGAGQTVSIYRNDGLGAFGAGQSFPAGSSPTSLAAADFDHDGDTDVAVTNRGFFAEGTTVNLLENDGSGAFGTRVTYSVGLGPRKILAADLNADGWADLAIANDPNGSVRNRVTVLINDAGGGFAPAVVYDASLPQGYAADGGACLAAGDMDNDGDVDLVYSSRKIYIDGILPRGGYQVFSNNGDGTFGPKVYKTFDVAYSQGVEDLEIADLDGNGWPDIVAAQFSDSQESAYYVVRRSGAADYPPAQAYAGGHGVYDVALGDANGDGAVDVFTNDYYSYDVSVHENLGTGVFRAAARFDTTTLHAWMDHGDIDGDGDLDVVTAGGYGTSGGVSVLRNNGQAAFTAPQEYWETNYPGGIKLRDLDGNGSLDMVWGEFNAPNGVPLHVLYRLNDGAGNFGPSVVVTMSMADVNDVEAIDLDHDGRLDIVASDSLRDQIKVARNLGNGAFSSPAIYPGPTDPTKMVFGDFDGDGHLDVAVTGPEPYGYGHSVSVLRGNGNATFQAPTIYTVDDGPYAIAAGDFDGDGDLDLATANRGFENDRQPSLSVLINSGNGTFQGETRYTNSALAQSTHMISADADGDGDADLLASNYSSNAVSFFANRGDGTFEPHVRFGVDTGIIDFRYADFDGDGIADVAGLCSLPLPGLRTAVSIVRGAAVQGPFVTTDAPTGVTNTSAILQATVNPDGFRTTAFFRYGTTAAYGLRTPTQSVGSGNSPVAVSAQVSGLTCGTTYHYRVSAVYARGPKSSRGIRSGADRTFTTAACRPRPFWPRPASRPGPGSR